MLNPSHHLSFQSLPKLSLNHAYVGSFVRPCEVEAVVSVEFEEVVTIKS